MKGGKTCGRKKTLVLVCFLKFYNNCHRLFSMRIDVTGLHLHPSINRKIEFEVMFATIILIIFILSFESL